MAEFKFHLPSRESILNSPNGRHMLCFIETDDPDSSCILITGCPGSGKTTISIHRLIRLCAQGKKALLFTYQHMLRIAIQNLSGSAGVPAECVGTIKDWYYKKTRKWLDFDSAKVSEDEIFKALEQAGLHGDEIIFDEGQDLPATVFQAFPRFFDRVAVGADDGQRVHELGAGIGVIRECLKNKGVIQECPLQYNYRNTFDIFDFARQFVPHDPRASDPLTLEKLKMSQSDEDSKPRVYLYQNNKQQDLRLRHIIEDSPGNIAVLCAVKTDVYDYARRLREMGFTVTSYTSDDYRNPPANLEQIVVTTYISSKGMEFDVVIIPTLNFWKQIQTEWFVACTRARRDLHVFCKGKFLVAPLNRFRKDSFEGPIDLTKSVMLDDVDIPS